MDSENCEWMVKTPRYLGGSCGWVSQPDCAKLGARDKVSTSGDLPARCMNKQHTCALAPVPSENKWMLMKPPTP
eukprot:600654-Amphidinium_carterae.1